MTSFDERRLARMIERLPDRPDHVISIEREGKPIAVIVPIDRWLEMRQLEDTP